MKRDLPPRMHWKDGGFYYVRGNKWTHLGGDRLSANARYSRIEHGLDAGGNGGPAWLSMERYMPQVFHTARKNARTREISFVLTRIEYDVIVKRAAGLCEVTGIPFQLAIRPGSQRRPWAPSLDRISAADHYHDANCRLVCGIVNAAMSDWGEDVFWNLVRRAKRKL